MEENSAIKQLINVLDEGGQNGMWQQIKIEDMQKLSELVIKMYGYNLKCK